MNCATCTANISANPRRSMKEVSFSRCTTACHSSSIHYLWSCNHSIYQIKTLSTQRLSTLKLSHAKGLKINSVESFLIIRHSKSLKLRILNPLCNSSLFFFFQFQDVNSNRESIFRYFISFKRIFNMMQSIRKVFLCSSIAIEHPPVCPRKPFAWSIGKRKKDRW